MYLLLSLSSLSSHSDPGTLARPLSPFHRWTRGRGVGRTGSGGPAGRAAEPEGDSGWRSPGV